MQHDICHEYVLWTDFNLAGFIVGAITLACGPGQLVGLVGVARGD